MNRRIVFLAATALFATGASQFGASGLLATNSSANLQESSADWRLVWSDEFDGSEIDEAKWSHEVNCWGGGNNEKQCYTDQPENASVADGMLTITALQQETTGFALPGQMRGDGEAEMATLPYSSARLVTSGKADWKYGKFEIRAKLPYGQGTWPAIWMLPRDEYYGPWAASGEIDILEAVNLGAACDTCDGGKENKILGTLHFGGTWPKNHHKGNATVLPITEDGFNVFGIEWEEGEVRWYVDGQHYATLKPEDWSTTSELAEGNPAAPFDRPFYMILNLAIGGHLSEDLNEKGIDPIGYPKHLIVDYVRVYQRGEGSGR